MTRALSPFEWAAVSVPGLTPPARLANPSLSASATATSGPHHRLVKWVQSEAIPEGQTLSLTNSHIELGPGLSYWNVDQNGTGVTSLQSM